jgi:hypothetical protein
LLFEYDDDGTLPDAAWGNGAVFGRWGALLPSDAAKRATISFAASPSKGK